MDNLDKSEKIKLLSQGSYGCVYRPGLNCQKKVESDKFVRKIQEKDTNAMKEIDIGKKIKNIKNYQHFFAPIISSCPVSISSIEKDEIKNCKIFNDTKSKYVSNKIIYVGNETLEQFLLYLYESNPNNFFRLFINTHIDILDAISLLNDNNIIHMDIKENNILFNKKMNKPILIDFGLSFDKNDINDKNIGIPFYIFASYTPWCFDIYVINYPIHKLNETDWKTEIVTEIHIKTICDSFIDDNKLFKELFDDKDLNMFKEKSFTYMKSFIGKDWKTTVFELLKFSNTWDNYSVSIMYLIIFRNIFDTDSFPFFIEYFELLKTNLFSIPSERLTTSVMKTNVSSIFDKILVKTKKQLDESIKKNSVNSVFIKTIKDTYAKKKLDNLTTEKDIYVL